MAIQPTVGMLPRSASAIRDRADDVPEHEQGGADPCHTARPHVVDDRRCPVALIGRHASTPARYNESSANMMEPPR